MNGLVSVIIPTYGARGQLIESIKSVLSQTYHSIEIIVIDDNSPGTVARTTTEKQMAEFSEFTNVKYIRHLKNLNGAAARNTGIKASQGEYIAFLDDDDTFKSSKIERQINFLSNHPEYDCAYCLAADNEGAIKTTPFEGDVSLPLLLGKSCLFTPSLIFRKKSLLNIGGFDESFRRHQDYELLLKFFSAGYKIGCVKEVLLNLGSNLGENALHGVELEDLKSRFLDQFNPVITKLDNQHPGTKNKILVYHYSKVFIDHIKTHNWILAIRIICKYYKKGPSIFNQQVFSTAKHVLFGK